MQQKWREKAITLYGYLWLVASFHWGFSGIFRFFSYPQLSRSRYDTTVEFRSGRRLPDHSKNIDSYIFQTLWFASFLLHDPILTFSSWKSGLIFVSWIFWHTKSFKVNTIILRYPSNAAAKQTPDHHPSTAVLDSRYEVFLVNCCLVFNRHDIKVKQLHFNLICPL